MRLGLVRQEARHLLPHSLKRFFRYAIAAVLLSVLLFVGLAVSGLIHVPPTAIAVWVLIFPLAVAGLIAGFIGPLTAGMLSVAFSRAEIGQWIRVGNTDPPIAEGRCVALSMMDIQLEHDGGVTSVTWSFLQTQPMTVMPGPSNSTRA